MRDLSKVRFITDTIYKSAVLRSVGNYNFCEGGYRLTIYVAGNYAYARCVNVFNPDPIYKRFDLRVWDIYEVQRYMFDD